MKRRRFLSLSAAFMCAPRAAHSATWRGKALGASVSVSLDGPRDLVDETLLRLPAKLDAFEDLFSLYRANSFLSRLNTAKEMSAPPAIFVDLMREVDTAHRMTDGHFDPTVQALWIALALGQNTDAAQDQVDWKRVSVSEDRVSLGVGQSLTLNGIAQGFATDMIRHELERLGFTRALVNIGEFAALGGPFRLGIMDPAAGLIGQKTITTGAIATSSPRAMLLGGQPHIIGPQGQLPIWSTISVEAPSAARADAISTAAVFMTSTRLAQLTSETDNLRISAMDADGNLSTF